MGKHIHTHRNNIYISGTFSISKQRPFNTVGSCKDSQFCSGHAASSVIMRMQAEYDAVPVFQMLMHILKLAGKHMRHCIFHGCRNVNDCFVLLRRFPHVKNCVAHLYCIINLCPRETLRTVLERKVSVRLGRQLEKKLGAVNRNLLHLFFALPENLLPLGYRGRIIQMYHCMRRPLHSLEGFLNNMLPGLGKHLHRNILGNHILFDQCPHKLIFRLGCCRKSHFNLFKAYIDQHLEKLQLLAKTHGFNERLISVSQINAAPHRRLVDIFLLYPVISDLGRHKIRTFIFVAVFHILDLSF